MVVAWALVVLAWGQGLGAPVQVGWVTFSMDTNLPTKSHTPPPLFLPSPSECSHFPPSSHPRSS